MFASVAITDDGHLAVLAAGRLTLYALASGRAVGTCEVEGGDAVVAIRGHLLVHGGDVAGSALTLLATPGLTVAARLEGPSPTRLVTGAGRVAVVERGDEALIASGAGGAITLASLRPPTLFDLAFGLEGDELLTFGPRGAEVWDVARRQPLRRLALDLPDATVACGVTARSSALWIATDAPALTTLRLSDGRAVELALDAPPRRVRSDARLAWLTAELDGVTVAIDVSRGVVAPLPADLGPVVAVAPIGERATACAVALDGGGLRIVRLGEGGASEVVAPREVVAAPPAPIAPVAPVAPVAPAAPAPAPNARRSVQEQLAALGLAPAAVAPPAPPVAAVAPRAGMRWRDELLAWTRAPAGPPPSLAGSPLAALHQRLGHVPATWPMLCALYGAWLEGDEGGIASARLAELAAPAEERWDAALGGELAAGGVATWRRGRARLAPAYGDFLDGRGPQAIERVGAAPPIAVVAPPRGRYTIVVDGRLAATVRALAAQLGELGFYAPRPGAPIALARARVEAWLRGWALATTAPLTGVAAQPGECLIWLASPAHATSSGAPPPWPGATAGSVTTAGTGI